MEGTASYGRQTLHEKDGREAPSRDFVRDVPLHAHAFPPCRRVPAKSAEEKAGDDDTTARKPWALADRGLVAGFGLPFSLQFLVSLSRRFVAFQFRRDEHIERGLNDFGC